MKDDHMGNGQLKPAYNLQISTENQIITHYQLFPNPTDFRTFKPFNEGFKERYQRLPETEVADSGYGSEENYEYAENNNIQSFIKYPGFHAEQKKKYRSNAFLPDNLFYNKEKDYFICPMGQRMEKQHVTKTTNASGYPSEMTAYQAKNCESCPLKCMCFKAKGNRTIEINHNLRRLKNNARELLHSEEGVEHRKRRCCEPEPVFSHIRYDGQYLRFRHFGQDKVEMDFAIFAIALNINKIHKNRVKTSKNPKNSRKFAQHPTIFVICYFFIPQTLPTEHFSLKLVA
jgi:hypothetical protein